MPLFDGNNEMAAIYDGDASVQLLYDGKDRIWPSFFKVKQVACGYSFIAAVLESDLLYTAGVNDCGQLCRNVPNGSFSKTNFGRVTTIANVKQVSCGLYHIAVVTHGGDLYTAGSNSVGQLCRNAVTGSANATNFGRVDTMTGVSAVCCGMNNTHILKTNGEYWNGGENNYGQLCRITGNGSATATNLDQVPGVSDATQVSAAAWSTALIRGNNQLWTAGRNETGNLGRNGQNGDPYVPNFGQVTSLTASFLHVAMGNGPAPAGNIYVVTGDGRFFTGGDNTYGQLCRNAASGTYGVTNFDQVPGITNATRVFAGIENYAVFLIRQGQLWSAGSNWYGTLCRAVQFGSELDTNFGQVPGVTGMANTDNVVSNYYGNTAFVQGDQLWTAGDGTSGQLCRPVITDMPNEFWTNLDRV